jgi:nifR3 family TIM-barrel protein
MRIGPHTLASNLMLSPLAGYTNLPMRLTLRELGGLGWGVTDLINARSLIERNPAALRFAARHPDDRPMAIQLFGSVPGEMRDAAAICQELGAEAVDINMGCPVRKVLQVGGGSAMMTELDRTAALVRGMVEAVSIPVTAKMRLGWDDQNITAPDLARVLEDVGVAAICVHGRTRAQGFGGRVNLAGIRAVVQAVKRIPVIGNGDVTTPESAKRMIDETGCAGVAIGRGAFYDPWIFRRTDAFLRTGTLPPEPIFDERLAVMRKHFERYCEFYGEERGAVFFRKVAPWYARRFGPAKRFRQGVVKISSREDFEGVLRDYLPWRARFCDENGELPAKYAPAPLASSFMEEGECAPAAIPFPKGPVDRW